MFLGLEHTAIASPDPARLAQWYVDTLGFHINFRSGPNPVESQGNRLVFFADADGNLLHLVSRETPLP